MTKINNLAVIIVAYDNGEEILQLFSSLATQKKTGDYVVVVDNHPDHRTAEYARTSKVVDAVIESDNVGFAEGCNKGVSASPVDIPLVMFINPDTIPAPNALEFLRNHALPEWAGWMPLIVMPNGKVNSAGNVLHMSGLSWCDGFGEDVSLYEAENPKEVNLLSGACMVFRRDVLDDVGGLPSDYFMYYEDTDLSLILKMRGHALGLLPGAKVTHDYVFSKSKTKFFYLERNRLLFIIKLWPASLLVIFSPMLLLTEIGLVLVSIIQRRFLIKLKSYGSLLKNLGSIISSRKQSRLASNLTTKEFMDILRTDVDTKVVSPILRSKLVCSFFGYYMKFAKLFFS